MNQKELQPKKNPSIIIVLIVVAILLAGGIFVIYKMKNNTQSKTPVVNPPKTEVNNTENNTEDEVNEPEVVLTPEVQEKVNAKQNAIKQLQEKMNQLDNSRKSQIVAKKADLQSQRNHKIYEIDNVNVDIQYATKPAEKQQYETQKATLQQEKDALEQQLIDLEQNPLQKDLYDYEITKLSIEIEQLKDPNIESLELPNGQTLTISQKLKNVANNTRLKQIAMKKVLLDYKSSLTEQEKATLKQEIADLEAQK